MPAIRTADFHSCLAGTVPAENARLAAVLELIGSKPPEVVAKIDVTAIGTIEPDVLLMDVDDLETDPLEAVRMVRFLLHQSVIAVYTNRLERSWGLQCHLAGASCLLSKLGSDDQTALGLMWAIRTGCYTDPAFEAA
jgi:DNA-binding NarL/FixJ family response regulator